MIAAGAAGSWQATFTSLVRELAASDPGGAAAGALRSTLGMAQNAEEELALDDLCHVIEYFNLSISRTQYERLTELAGELGVADIPQSIDLGSSLGHSPCRPCDTARTGARLRVEPVRAAR